MTATDITFVQPANVLRKSQSYMYDGLYSYFVDTWDMETGRPRVIGYGTGYDGPPAEYCAVRVNATPEAIAADAAWAKAQTHELSVSLTLNERNRVESAILKGDRVVVVSGRKVAKGTQGIVFWMEEGGYNKVGIALSGATDAQGRFTDVAWTYLQNIARVGGHVWTRAEVEALFAA